jgi:hypothetical protein
MVAWTPVRADEIDAGADRFASQTFELTVPLLTNFGVRPTAVSVFLPRLAANANVVQVHVFWSPGNATETGITKMPPSRSQVGYNAVMMHGLRGSTDASGWILIGVPGIENGFVVMDEAGVTACLSAANDGDSYSAGDIWQLRLSAHSRGAAGLTQTLHRRLLPPAKVDRVVIFDAVDASVNSVLFTAGISGDKQFAYQVNVSHQLSARGATNVALNPHAARAIGYCRLLADAPIAVPLAGGPVPSYAGSLLPLPPRTTFTTRPGAPSTMVNINAFATANRGQIGSIVGAEDRPSVGMKSIIDANNLTRMYSSPPFSAGILSHHLFVAELAHEIVDDLP